MNVIHFLRSFLNKQETTSIHIYSYLSLSIAQAYMGTQGSRAICTQSRPSTHPHIHIHVYFDNTDRLATTMAVMSGTKNWTRMNVCMHLCMYLSLCLGVSTSKWTYIDAHTRAFL